MGGGVKLPESTRKLKLISLTPLPSSLVPNDLTLDQLLSSLLPRHHSSKILEFDNAFPALLPSLALAILAILMTHHSIQGTKEIFRERGFKGRDLLKSDGVEIPESMGLPSATIYMLVLFLFIPFRYFSTSFSHPADGSDLQNSIAVPTSATRGWEGEMDGRGGFPHHELASFLSALLSLLSAILLGFLDDVFDIRWRYKLPIPIVSSIPLLIVYFAGGGGTSVVVPGWPRWLRSWIGKDIVDLGPIYYLYMSLLSTFCTNSINILAGINGVEVGQALVICVSLVINDLLYLDPRAGQPGSRSSVELLRRHLFSLYLLLPLTGCCIGLLAWNRFPSKVFVGDTFCYFAGMVFSCVGILGHFSKTLLLFFLPQVFNFVLSCPQLFGLVPCPRHRVPDLNHETGLLHPSKAKLESRPGRFTTLILESFSSIGLVELEYSDGKREIPPRTIVSTTNLTLLNSILVLRRVRSLDRSTESQRRRNQEGKGLSEQQLWFHVISIQILGSLIAFAIRYWVASIVFP
ncbi:hypothetical protein IE53DRAFT_363231 [Violaceomyces palustris]|uniref:Uncharacterized protein n=1 Tax=Violaceomyces palustris TaxID=1673888 RepID=A0ACD0NU36_9BASI|nr:hypothetical protein IE53DRAFT_363231 [Violaceomyces palustris]